ncbi:hypothetical protein [Neorhizobium huautlense]|uniref:hypothetical protein n=1 Tax=Neorhizobium huautlense TaxID=67774 RepID=UPI000CF95447|nr:hypothetical protein [Neorhizobium huautlense]
MGPRREVYELEKNELEQQYAQHSLDKDMAAAYRSSLAKDPKEHARKLKAENRGLLLFLVLLGVVVAVAFAIS